jgi:hypothetical protein
MKLNDVHKKVLADITIDCIDNGITLKISNQKKVKVNDGETLGCAGFFDEARRELAVASGMPTKYWFQVLLHEYNHMRQWIDKIFSKPKYSNTFDLWTWLDGSIELSSKDVSDTVSKIRNLELDCEKRTAKMIGEYPGLNINVSEYIKGANSYLYFYEIVRKHRKWCKKAPYKIKEIIKLMPDYFLTNYTKLPKGYEKLVIKKCL